MDLKDRDLLEKRLQKYDELLRRLPPDDPEVPGLVRHRQDIQEILEGCAPWRKRKARTSCPSTGVKYRFAVIYRNTAQILSSRGSSERPVLSRIRSFARVQYFDTGGQSLLAIVLPQ